MKAKSKKVLNFVVLFALLAGAQACTFVYLKQSSPPPHDNWKITVLSLEDHGKWTFVDMGIMDSLYYRIRNNKSERFIVARILIENRTDQERKIGYKDFKLGKEIPAYAFKGRTPRPPGLVSPPKVLRFKVPPRSSRWVHLLYAISSFREPGYIILGPAGRVNLPNRPGNVPYHEKPATPPGAPK